MTRKELEEATRHATRVTQQREVLIIGSQAILGSYDEGQLPERATLSEVAIAPITYDKDYTLATIIDAELGEWSQDHGLDIQGANVTMAVLPNGWEALTVQVAPNGPGGDRGRYFGCFCLHPCARHRVVPMTHKVWGGFEGPC